MKWSYFAKRLFTGFLYQMKSTDFKNAVERIEIRYPDAVVEIGTEMRKGDVLLEVRAGDMMLMGLQTIEQVAPKTWRCSVVYARPFSEEFDYPHCEKERVLCLTTR